MRDTILGIGYDSSKEGFDGASCGVSVSLGSQSPAIAQGVNSAVELREGNSEHALDVQGRMFGFACSKTPELMPRPAALAHRLDDLRATPTAPSLHAVPMTVWHC